MFEIPLKYIY